MATFLFLTTLFLLPITDTVKAEDSERDDKVWSVSFEGNENFRSMVLSDIIATQRPNRIRKLFGRHNETRFLLNETELRRDRVRIERFYQRRGFNNVEVDFEISSRGREWKKDVTFVINEGTPVRIRSSEIVIIADDEIKREIRDSREFQRAGDRHEFREGNRYQTLLRADVEGRYLQVIENLGFAWPEVSVEADIDEATNEADVRIVITPNDKTYFSDIRIEGDISVSERIILRETDIREGEPYSRDKMQEAQRQIFNHHLFRFATVTLPEQPRDSTLDVLIRVREHPKRSVQAGIGFGREELLRGQLSWMHRNVVGTGHRFGVNTRASFIEQRLSTDYLIPYVFNPKSSNVSTIFGVHKIEPAFELLQAGFNNSLIYQFNRNTTASASYEFSINEELSRDQDVSLPDSVINYNVSSLSFSGYYSEGLSREPRGWVVQPFIEFSGTFGESSLTYQKVSLDVRRYTQLGGSTTFAARVNVGSIFNSSREDLPSNILFFTGGTNSVRGWTRQDLGPKRATFSGEDFTGYVPIGGRALLNFNTEIRQDIGRIIPNFGLSAFLDGGQVWRSARAVDSRPIQFGAGGGIRYQSPIGPVRIDVGYKLNPTAEDLNEFEGQDFGSRMDRIGIHFSIGQAF
ncbi:MAG: BamA/TamA family outer membrane protein [Balneolaceae bacterium]|nr:BamA/TamA family outer membrane protein [Balneolaceae bacterium]MCH8549891.1 BamA/TamA family outer membrane protein [Balneolaceae bacterium]